MDVRAVRHIVSIGSRRNAECEQHVCGQRWIFDDARRTGRAVRFIFAAGPRRRSVRSWATVFTDHRCRAIANPSPNSAGRGQSPRPAVRGRAAESAVETRKPPTSAWTPPPCSVLWRWESSSSRPGRSGTDRASMRRLHGGHEVVRRANLVAGRSGSRRTRACPALVQVNRAGHAPVNHRVGVMMRAPFPRPGRCRLANLHRGVLTYGLPRSTKWIREKWTTARTPATYAS